MDILAENLLIKTEIGQPGYRFHASHLPSGVEYSSEWFLRYDRFLLKRSLFILSAKMADRFECPTYLIDFNTDTILDFNYKFKIALEMPLFGTSASYLWGSNRKYQLHKRSLLKNGKVEGEAKLKTWANQRVLKFSIQSELHLVSSLNTFIAVERLYA